MEFSYKCPVCRANNTLTNQILYCRRCKSDLSSIYNLKKQESFKLIELIIKKESSRYTLKYNGKRII